MKYSLKNIELRKADRTGSEFIIASAWNPTNIRGSKPTYTEFDQDLVAMYKQFMSPSSDPSLAAKGVMVWDENKVNAPGVDKDLVESLTSLPCAFLVTKALPCISYRKYTRPFKDALGRMHPQGSLVCLSDGVTPKPYSNVQVLCLKEVDNETGELDWVKGKDPNTVMLQQWSNMFQPAVEAQAIPVAAQPQPEQQVPQNQPNPPQGFEGQPNPQPNPFNIPVNQPPF